MVKKLSSVIIIVLFLIITIMTIYKMNKRHEDKLYSVLYSEIKYAANRCYLEKKCENNIILSELYEKEYLKVQYDPITKEELNNNIKIEIKDNKINIKK